MRKYMSIFDPSHEKLIEFINRYYTRRNEPDSEPIIYLM